MRVNRRGPAVLLAMLYIVSGLFCLAGAASPLARETPVALLWSMGAAAIVIGVGLWLLSNRIRHGALHVAVALGSALIGLLAWESVTAVGVVGLGPVLIALALYLAHVFDLTAARLHAAFLVVVTTAGAVASEAERFTVQWATLMVAVLAFTETQGRLSSSLRTAATTDSLTGVANRGAWESEASRDLARALRTREPLSFALLDLDHFKEVNDRDGHSAGDALLRELTGCWTRRLRRADLLGRYGGDEFVLCLPATDEHGAGEMLERLEAAHPFPWSAGVATVQDGDTLSAVLGRADAQLYLQKRTGRTS